ncbi:formyltransferase family protein [soil metagenome]
MDALSLTLPSSIDGFPVILFGLECQTTAIVLTEMLRAGVDVRLVCLPGRRSIPLLQTTSRNNLPMARRQIATNTVADIARMSGLDLWRIGNLRSSEVQNALDDVPADLIVVACYNRLVPGEMYSERLYGGLNIHPSLLPDKRGPDPLFWMFKVGDELAGTTIHRLTDEFDAGDILAQDSIPKPDGITERELDAKLSLLGARLLLETLHDLRSGNLQSHPQRAEIASWAPHPSPSDFVIDRSTPARLAYNFVRGLSGRGQPILIDTEQGQVQATAAHGWRAMDDPPAELPERAVEIKLADGWLVATLATDGA